MAKYTIAYCHFYFHLLTESHCQKSLAKRISSHAAALFPADLPKPPRKDRGVFNFNDKSTLVLFPLKNVNPSSESTNNKPKSKPTPFCPPFDHRDHYLNFCDNFKTFSTNKIITWMKEGQRYRRCGCNNATENCNLKYTTPYRAA